MIHSRIPGLLLVLLCFLVAAPALAGAGQSALHSAAALYEQGQYDKALKQYKKMARDGVTFAQYRMSYMSLMGLGTKPDVVESLAWAVLAAEGDHDELDRYQSAVAAMVPSDQRKKAEKKADYYVRRWGKDDRSGGGTLARSSEGGCTGSRLARNCGSEGGSGGLWISWGKDKSSDPGHRSQIEELNQAIVENAASIEANATGS